MIQPADPSAPPPAPAGTPPEHYTYAGGWRFLAFLIDTVVASIIAAILAFIAGAMMAVLADVKDTQSAELLGQIVGVISGWLYYAIMESSTTQATLGKMALGIIVTDEQGNRIGFGRATGRYFGKIISALILMIGYLMILFTKKKQGAHDIMAGTLVLRKVSPAKHANIVIDEN